jgi:hypothetical protein
MLEIDVDSGEKVILNLVNPANLVILSQFSAGLHDLQDYLLIIDRAFWRRAVR